MELQTKTTIDKIAQSLHEKYPQYSKAELIKIVNSQYLYILYMQRQVVTKPIHLYGFATFYFHRDRLLKYTKEYNPKYKWRNPACFKDGHLVIFGDGKRTIKKSKKTSV